MPMFVNSQTVHVDSDRIVYKGNIKLDNINKEELYSSAKNALLNNVRGNKEVIVEDNPEKGMIVSKGTIRLPSSYHIIKTIEYIFELSVEDGKYKYRIDSVYLKQVERGGETVSISSEKLLKGMSVSGPPAANTEKQLNEIDMNFQKLIALFNAEMKKTAVTKNTK